MFGLFGLGKRHALPLALFDIVHNKEKRGRRARFPFGRSQVARVQADNGLIVHVIDTLGVLMSFWI